MPERFEIPLDYDARLTRLEQNRIARARLDVEDQVLLAALASDVPPWLSPQQEKESVARQWVREDVACVLSIPSEVAAQRLHTAVTLVDQLPETLAMVGSGGISLWHALSMVDTVSPLSPEVAAAVQARVLGNADGQSLSNFRRALGRAVKAIDPSNAEKRRKRGLKDRRVGIRHDEDGMCSVFAYLPSEGGIDLMNRLDAEAGAAGDADVRTLDQRRADALVGIARGDGSATKVEGPTVYIAMSTLLGEDDEPGELVGAGSITAAQAREIALSSDASWWNLKMDEQGRMLDMSRTRYRPSAALRRFIEKRDRYCRFPHCRRRAAKCDIDHCEAWSAKKGTTCPGNLHPLCKRHHRLKHRSGWRVVMHADGRTEWTGPSGRKTVVPAAEIPRDRPGTDSLGRRSRDKPPDTCDPPLAS